jgi:hypothetical protein
MKSVCDEKSREKEEENMTQGGTTAVVKRKQT